MIIKSEKELEILREGGRRLAFVMSELVKKTKVGISTILSHIQRVSVFPLMKI